MKFLAVAFAIVFVIQLAEVAADKLPFNDLIDAHGEQQNLGNSHADIATEDLKSLLGRRNCNSWCIGHCRNRIGDIFSFMDLIEEQNVENNYAKMANEDLQRNCVAWCLSWCRRSIA